MVMPQDVEAVCSTQTVSHIFDMLEAVANKNKEKALSLYYDLLTLKEPPMRILYLIVRQFNGILQAKELAARGLSSKEIASAIKVAPVLSRSSSHAASLILNHWKPSFLLSTF